MLGIEEGRVSMRAMQKVFVFGVKILYLINLKVGSQVLSNVKLEGYEHGLSRLAVA